MKAVILAAGEGVRLRPFTSSRPKVMIPVANRPILEYVVQALVENGIRDIVMVVGYRRERIMSHFGDGSAYDARINYAMQEKQLGTAHALLAAKGMAGKEFLVLAGDNVVDARFVSDLIGVEDGSAISVAQSEMASKYGVVSLDGDKVTNIVEKPTSTQERVVSTGAYRLNSSVFELLEKEASRGVMSLTHVLGSNLRKLDMRAVRTSGKWMDVVYPWDLLKVNAAAMTWAGLSIEGTVEDDVILKGPVAIGAGSRIRSGSYVEGPVVIGQGCDIGPLVTIQPSTSIGDAVVVGPYTHIFESVIMGGASVGSHSHISHSVMDEGTSVGPGFMAAGTTANVRVENEFFGLKRIGTLVGESSVIGAGVTCVSGTIIGAESKIADHATIRGTLENRSIVI